MDSAFENSSFAPLREVPTPDPDLVTAWAGPVVLLLDALAEAAADRGTSAEALLGLCERAADSLPDLAREADWLSLADAMALPMAAAAVEEISTRRPRSSQRKNSEVEHQDSIFLRALCDLRVEVSAFGFDPIAAAVERLRNKTPVVSALRTKQWERVPLALVERAQFSAGVESIRVMANVQEKLLKTLSHERELLANGKEAFVDRDSFVRDLRRIAREEGLDTGSDGLTNIAAQSRLKLIYDMQTESARGYARFTIDNDPDALSVVPAWRLGGSIAKEPRPDAWWRSRWAAAGAAVEWQGALRDSFVALKPSPIWSALSRFGTPWPPFDFGSTRMVEDVDRQEAEALGLLKPGDTVEPTAARDFNERLEASASNISAPMARYLKECFGDQVAWEPERQKFSWRGNLIGNLYDRVLADPAENASINVGMTSRRTARLAARAGHNVKNVELQIRGSEIRHSLHGGERPLTRLDWELVPHVWRDPDDVEPGHKKRSLTFGKTIAGKHVAAVYQHDPDQPERMFVNTLWVEDEAR